MLRIIQNQSAAGAKSYYSTADYYKEGQELEGSWRGQAASRLGLTGQVDKAAWDQLCDNRHPVTGDPLTSRIKADRTIGYDFNFHLPKSSSLLYALTRDERLLEAFRDAVDGTMHDMETEMQTRVRINGRNEDRTTGNMVWGEFIHLTARPVDGIPDPHLHAHCFVFNTTFDAKEDRFKAGQFRDLKRDAPYFGAVFHSRLSHRIEQLGLPVERTRKGWELKGLDSSTLSKFSRRTSLIEEMAREKGIDDPDAKSQLGAKTRRRKEKELSFDHLQSEWRSKLSPEELETIENLKLRIGGDAEPADSNQAAKAVDLAILHAFERASVIPKRQLITHALKREYGKASAKEIIAETDRRPLLEGRRKGRVMVTTPEVYQEERRIIEFAREGRGSVRPFHKRPIAFRRDWQGDAQRKAAEHLLRSRDRLILLRSVVGVGKTTLMKEVNYRPGDVLVFHQNAKGFARGERVVFDGKVILPISRAKRFQVNRQSGHEFQIGDKIRITRNGMTSDKQHRLNNGSIFTISGWTKDGGIVLAENGWQIASDFGHLTHSYVVTSHASQGKSVDRVLIGQSSESSPASSREQFYVSVSRGAKQATIYTDDKEALREAIAESEERLAAVEHVAREHRQHEINLDREHIRIREERELSHER